VTLFDLTEVAEHNDDAHGYWLILDKTVYDVSELMRVHPGGPRILQLYAGRDATAGFRRIHHASETLSALLARARLGRVRELACDDRLAARALAEALSLIVEMQNALRADHAFRLQPLRPGPLPRRSRYELQRGIETHARFQREYLDVLLAVSLRALAAATLSPDAQDALHTRLDQLQSSQPWAAARAHPYALLHRFEGIADAELEACVASCEMLDSWLVAEWKRAVSGALRECERPRPAPRRPGETPAVGGVTACLLYAVQEYIQRVGTLDR